MENIVSDSCRWDEWRDQPEKEEWKEYIRVRNYDEWEDSHKSPHEATVLEQAETNLHGDSSLGYGLRGSRHGMSFEKSEEEKEIERLEAEADEEYREASEEE